MDPIQIQTTTYKQSIPLNMEIWLKATTSYITLTTSQKLRPKAKEIPKLYASALPSSFCGKCAFISSPSKSALYALQLA